MIEEDLVYYYTKQGLSYNQCAGGNGIKGFNHTDHTKNLLSKANINNTKARKTVLQYDLEGNLIGTYGSVSEAASKCGMHLTTISRALKGKSKNKKYIFKYG